MSRWLCPDDLRYSADHAWVRLEDDEAVIGVTDHFQETAGDILYVQLPREGAPLAAGETACTLEAGKWVGHIPSPLAGRVVAVNRALLDRPGLVNASPYGEGWLFRLAPAGAVPEGLMDAAAYRELLARPQGEEVGA